jgi:molybdenum cofactor biosynthesis enzyme MoaA
MKNDRTFVEDWRKNRSLSFNLKVNSTAMRIVEVDLWGQKYPVYANANLSVYSAQKCNAKCPFCVEELRPASRGNELESQKRIERSDRLYFDALEEVLHVTKEIHPSISITGGEASKDPRLARILVLLQRAGTRKRTMTTNGSGLLDIQENQRVIDWIVETELKHLNISRAHYNHDQIYKFLPD